jgi:hypothetical protein
MTETTLEIGANLRSVLVNLFILVAFVVYIVYKERRRRDVRHDDRISDGA